MTLCLRNQDVLAGETSQHRGSRSLTVGGRQNKPLTELKTWDKEREVNRVLTCRKEEFETFKLKEVKKTIRRNDLETYLTNLVSHWWTQSNEPSDQHELLLWHSERVQQTTSANTPSVSYLTPGTIKLYTEFIHVGEEREKGSKWTGICCVFLNTFLACLGYKFK